MNLVDTVEQGYSTIGYGDPGWNNRLNKLAFNVPLWITVGSWKVVELVVLVGPSPSRTNDQGFIKAALIQEVSNAG